MFSLKAKDTCTTGCCTPQPKGKEACPLCGALAKGVLAKTVKHMLSDQVKLEISCLEGFYYCQTPSCEVVYFREVEILTQKELEVTIGLKEGAVPATVCYCFDWTQEKIQAQLDATGQTTALQEIKAKIENPGCSCEMLNPSGGCCLGDVGKVIKALNG